MYDVLIIGSGPAGLSAALAARCHGLDYLVLERGVVANTIYRFPIAKTLFSTANELELNPGDFAAGYKPTREELLQYYCRLAAREQLNILTGVNVFDIQVLAGTLEEGFVVRSPEEAFEARNVIIAVGGFGRQRRLEIPGESPAMVSYSFVEAFPYATKKVVVAGGGNSAAEAALSLCEAGAGVTMAVRRASLDLLPRVGDGPSERAQIKPWVRRPLDEAVSAGRLQLLTSAHLIEIRPGAAVLQIAGPNAERFRFEEISCDHILALIGADPDTSLLERAGAAIAPDGRPVYDRVTYETSLPGLYVAGHLTRERHIKSAIQVGRKVVDAIASQMLVKYGT
ncbi:MAG TPA: NAD(P)-binding domain-containing protein [Blastocatellia bacterium]|nr:NAD(P)-binding domain-containing protein [Blastocatellia bacterium]